ncbi:hypothetical protein LSCM1_02566 [Leishmania martiniquensis]|uniref:CYC2-like cyclin n=1 Tax=Leishmania martiniquensis TaxID=1580590 RepID=A0A836G754_9TRYP|nr:hypothetical protein LSCM1_02566 [Leishmania martiniquensis]
MEMQVPMLTDGSAEQSAAAVALPTRSTHCGPHADKEPLTNSSPVTLGPRRQGGEGHIVKPAATPKGGDGVKDGDAAASLHTIEAEEHDACDTVNCSLLFSGDEEAVVPPSPSAATSAVGLPLTAPVSADGGDSHAVSAAGAASLVCSPPLQISLQETGRGVRNVPKAPENPGSFASRAMQAIALQASTAGPPLRLNCSRSDLSSLVGGASANDPMGMRHLYNLPGSGVGSSLGIPMLAQRGSAQPLIAADAFSMERFAAFFKVALVELMDECERRVANAPEAWRDFQRRLIGSGMNHDLATSTHSFDSPRSSAMSRLDGAPSSVALSCHTPVHPPCFANSPLNTNRFRHRELSDDIVAGPHRTAESHQPPSLLSLSSHMAFTSTAEQDHQVEEEKNTADDGVLSTLLASLGRYHGKMAPMVFIAGLAYLTRVTAQCTSEFLSVTRANWYRLTTTAILVAAKVYDDHSSSRLNACFARSSGIPLSEMSRLELDFLYLLDFDLLLKESEVEQWLVWMEALALRYDLMAPLNSYVLGTSAGPTAARVISTPKPSPASGPAFAEYRESSKTGAVCEASCTPGLSSEVAGGEEETTGTTLSSEVGLRSFSRVQVASDLVETAHGAVSATANSRSPADAAVAADAPCLTVPLTDLSNFPPRTSDIAVLPSTTLLDSTWSAPTTASLPGGAPSLLSCLGGSVPPLPIHDALLRPPAVTTRLFSVVHGTADPPSPISVRHLCRLGCSPPSPLRPPSVERQSPMHLFKSVGMHPHGPHRYFSAAAGSTALGLYGAADGGRKASKPSSQGGSTKAGQTSIAGRPSVSAEADTRRSTVAAASHRQSKQWGPFGMVQHVRDVLGVTASLVRGQLNVLAPSAQAEEMSRPPPRRSDSGSAYFPPPVKLVDERTPPAGGAPSASSFMPRQPTGSPCHRSGSATLDAITRHGMAPQSHPKHADPRSPADAGGDYYHSEEDEEYEEGEYGYYDEDGYFHYYCDDEDAEGEYDDYYDQEEEDEAAYFKRCRPPLTHSPPSL